MAVIWEPEFEHKHIVVVSETLSFVEMVKKGIAIYKDRLNGTNGQAKVKGKVKAGLMNGGNTLIITNTSGFAAMTSWVLNNGVSGAKKGTNEVPVLTGAIIQSKDLVSSNAIGFEGGTMHVAIKMNGTDKHVYHLQGSTVASKTYTAEDIIERNELLRGMLGGDGGAAAHSPGHVPDKLIKIIDGFCHGI